MCPICIFVSVETFLSLNMCHYDQSYNSLKCNQKFPKINHLKLDCSLPPLKTPPPSNFHLIMFGNDLMEIGLNWLGSSCKKDFRSICGNIQYFAKWRKFQKNSRKFIKKTKTHCVLSSLQLGLNLSNSTVVTF